MFTLAHLSDPHLPLPRPGPGSLGSKRFLGYLSWLRRRKAIHRPEVLAQVVDDVRAHAPDHVAITGDLCNISLPEEFRRAARWLEGLGPARDVTVVPGNHDAYVPVDPGSGFAAWRPYLDGDAAHSTFPAVRRRGPVALVGASTARPMSWVSAGGALGPDQIAAIEDRLSALGREGLFRVLLIHHPPLPEGPRRKRLRDMAPLAAAIARAGVELVLHGHTHRATLGALATPAGRAPVLGVASASASPAHHAEPACWNLIRVSRDGAAWRVAVTVRGLSGRTIGPLGDYAIAVPAHA
jgi:3',5'-cyclic AMP phosphodiesterase CpdA